MRLGWYFRPAPSFGSESNTHPTFRPSSLRIELSNGIESALPQYEQLRLSMPPLEQRITAPHTQSDSPKTDQCTVDCAPATETNKMPQEPRALSLTKPPTGNPGSPAEEPINAPFLTSSVALRVDSPDRDPAPVRHDGPLALRLPEPQDTRRTPETIDESPEVVAETPAQVVPEGVLTPRRSTRALGKRVRRWC